MEYESTVSGVLEAKRRKARDKHSFEDILYLLMGDATPGNVVVLIFGISFFAATPIAMLLLFGTYSGGMRWVITLGTMAAMGLVAVLLMRRGVTRPKKAAGKTEPKTEFPGELTGMTETFERAAMGYMYSQQMIRERLCEDIINKLGVSRDLGPDEMIAMLDAKDVSFVGDDLLAKFLLTFRRGVRSWDDSNGQARGKSEERGKAFMIEVDEILRRMEAIV